jgi:hypothetical protein
VIDAWGSAALFELAHPSTSQKAADSETWTATIPTHLRYVKPSHSSSSSSSSSTSHLSVPAPIVFWACNADEGTKFKVNPFDRENLGYDGLFGTKTMFYHVPPAPVMAEAENGLLLGLEVPVLEAAGAGWVSMATGAVVLVGFTWILWKILGGSPSKDKEVKEVKREE